MTEEKEEIIYIVGHKNPDTDSVSSAIAYANYLNKKGKKAVPAICGQINPETEFVLDYFKFKAPESLINAEGKKIILLDHNEKEQSLDNIEKAEILEVIDHHRISFDWSKPIFFQIEPVGSTSTLIARKYLNDKKIKIEGKIAGLLLSGILSDTVAFKSSTTTKEDIEIAEKLAKLSGIKNLEEFGIEIKKKKAIFIGQSLENIIYSDFKVFDFSGKKVGIGQVEICDLKEVEERKKELIEKLKEIAEKEKYNLLILIATNIIKPGSQLLFWGETNYIKTAFKKEIKNNSLYLEGVMSRKKEIVPPLMKAFSEN